MASGPRCTDLVLLGRVLGTVPWTRPFKTQRPGKPASLQRRDSLGQVLGTVPWTRPFRTRHVPGTRHASLRHGFGSNQDSSLFGHGFVFEGSSAGEICRVEARDSRLAKNEALFREVNERIVEITTGLTSGVAHSQGIDGLVCECADPLCSERIESLTIAEYEGVRSDPRRFIIAAGHQSPDVENVVEQQPAYWIVEKHEGVPADVARERDPRA